MRALFVLLLIASLLCLSGCKVSQTIMQKIHTQDAEQVDTESNVVYLKNSIESDVETDMVERLRDTVDRSNRVNLSSLDVEVAPLEANEQSNATKDEQSIDGATESERIELPPSERVQETDSANDNASSQTPAPSQDGSAAEGQGGGGQGESSAGDPTGSGGAGGNTPSSDPEADPEEPPVISGTIVAVGEVANIVCMLGSTNDLVATSENVRNAVDLYGKDIKTSAAVWSGDGKNALDDAGFESLLALHPSAAFVETGSTMFTDAQLASLDSAGVTVVPVDPLASAGGIKRAVQAIASSLNTPTALAKKDSYLALYDEIVNEALRANGGAVTTYNNLDYNTGESLAGASSKQDMWTLYIDSWDENARHTSSRVNSDNGVGAALLGYKGKPVSYFMSVGGVINNAAALVQLDNMGDYQNRRLIVWQFSNNALSAAKLNWSPSGAFQNLRDMKRSGFDECLLRIPAAGGSWLGLGASCFPGIVVASQSMKSHLEADRDGGNGLYSVYPKEELGPTTDVGILGDGDIVPSHIGAQRTGKIGEPIASSYVVYVNPHGITASWADGSVESPLESLWVASTFQGLDGNVVRSYIKRFYQDMYGFSLDEGTVDAILCGSYYGG